MVDFLLGLVLLATSPLWGLWLLSKSHRRAHWIERLRRLQTGSFDLWVHGASVGEILALETLLTGLRRERPTLRILVTVNTLAGRAAAKAKYPYCAVQLAPLDWGPILRRFMKGLNPKLHILSELDIWPSRQRELSRRGIPTLVAGARMSAKGFQRTRWAWFLMGPAYGHVQHWACRDEATKDRLAQLGIEPTRLAVSGSLKFDALLGPLKPVPEAARLVGDRPWVVAGSLHPGEEGPFIELAKRGVCRVLLAPRHLHRLDQFEMAIRSAGVEHERWTSWRNEGVPLVLMDEMGVLAHLYSKASVAFVGGSLVPVGGHNMLEPARFGVPVVVGPHTHHFEEEMAALRLREGVMETSLEKAARDIQGLLSSRNRCESMGRQARSGLEGLAGGSTRVHTQVMAMLEPG
ncbi:MAG: 3-deoxy-D-manno-octulosonic acid transferase [Planctomycetota bacterium]